MSPVPKCFMSYSHDNKEHEEWVLSLATRLRENGVDVILDQW
ncbi:SEFIR domain-containing protein, partial [Bathymodiolus thermophilus thioautotrophic gill symbiont]